MTCPTIVEFLVWIFGVLGIIGNIIAYCTLGRIGTQNASTVLLRFMACVDTFLLLVLIFSIVQVHLFINLDSNTAWLCYMSNMFQALNVESITRTATIWTPVLIGIHRYFIVCRPLWAAQFCTIGNARKHSFCVIVFSVIVNLPKFFMYKTEWVIPYEPCHVKGLTYMSNSDWYHIGYDKVCLTGLINYAIPVLSMLFITVRLLQTLHYSRRRRMGMRGGQDQSRDSRNVDMMVIVVLMVFLICHTAFPVARFLLVETSVVWECILVVMILIFVLLNCSVNVFIYVAFNRKFRKALCKCPASAVCRSNVNQET